MDFLYYYFIFALSGTIVSIIVHYIPLLKMAKESEKDSIFNRSPLLSLAVWSVLYFIMVPVLIRTILFESHKTKFIEHTFQLSLAD